MDYFKEEDPEEWVFDSLEEAECSLEWFDSDDQEENATVRDAKGRAVRLKLKMLNVTTFELVNSADG